MYTVFNTMCWSQCVPGAAGCRLEVQESSTTHHSFEQIWNRKYCDHLNQYWDRDWINLSRNEIYHRERFYLPPATECRQKFLLRQTAIYIDVRRYTLRQVADLDMHNHCPPVRLPSIRLYLDWNSGILDIHSVFLKFILLRLYECVVICIQQLLMYY